MTLEILKSTVAQTRVPIAGAAPLTGTAFLVTRSLAVTCAHCLGSAENAASEVELYFSRWQEDRRTTRGEVVHADWELDVALLRLSAEAPVDALSRIPRGRNGDPWTSFGHPEQVEADGIRFAGEVADARAALFGKDVMHLHCEEAENSVRGASGSPVMIDGQIAGLFTNQLLEYASDAGSTETKPAYKAVYALPTEAFEALPAFARVLHGEAPTRSRDIVRAVSERAKAATRKRVAGDGKYIEARYVERESVQAPFDAFMAQVERGCFLVIGKAGAGKTTTLSALALHHTPGPALFFRGGIDRYSIKDVTEFVTSTLIDPRAEPGTAPRDWDELMSSLRSCGTPLVLFIDAINESEFEAIPERRLDLQRLLEFVEGLPIRVVVSCRDVFWTYFVDPRGPNKDFWWNHVWDPSYAMRLQEEIERQRTKHEEAQTQASKKGAAAATPLDPRVLQAAATSLVDHRPSLFLGDFTPEELAAALDRYAVSPVSDELLQQLRHPLLLHLYSEFATEALEENDMTLGDLLGRYVEYKLASVQRALPLYDANAANRLLKKLTASMRASKYGKVGSELLDKLVQGDRDLEAVKTHLLDEGIVLEHKGDRLVGFQFDALFEYMLSRELAEQFSKSDDVERVAADVIAEAAHFESIVGALEYFCSGLEAHDAERCARIVASFAGGNSFGKETLLRVLVHLKRPFDSRIADAVLSALGDREVDGDLAVETIGKLLEMHPELISSLAEAIVARASDLAGVRCAGVIKEPVSISSKGRMELAVALLASPSFDIAAAVIENLRSALRLVPSFREPSRAALIDGADLTVLLGHAIERNISFPGLMLLVGGVLPELVGKLPVGVIGGVFSAMMGRPQFNLFLHGGRLTSLVRALVAGESDDLLVFMDLAGDHPEMTLVIVGTLQQALVSEPAKTGWLLATFLRRALSKKKGVELAWVLLGSLIERQPDVGERLAAWLDPRELDEIWAQVRKFGLRREGTTDFAAALLPLTAAVAALVSLSFRFACIRWLPRTAGSSVVPGALLGISAAHIAFVSLLVMPLVGRMLRFGSYGRWAMAALFGGAAAGTVAFHPNWLMSAAVCGGVAVVLFDWFKGGVSGKVLRTLSISVFTYAGLGLALAAPTAWLSRHFGWEGAFASIAVVLCLFRSLDFGSSSLLSAIGPWASARAASLVLLVMAGVAGKGSFASFAALSIAVGVFQPLLPTVLLGRRDGTMRGFVGGWLLIVAVGAAVGVTLLAWLAIWSWALALLAVAAFLLLPISDMNSWVLMRAAPTGEQGLFSAIAGLLTWWTWDTPHGWPALYAQASWWTLVFSSQAVIMAFVGGRKRIRELKRSARAHVVPGLATRI